MPLDLAQLEPPPQVVLDEGAALAAALDGALPRRQLDRNLLLATWNLREFGSLTRKWAAGERDSPKRELRALRAIAAVVERFDVVALQEVGGDLRALRHLIKVLEPNWAFLMTDACGGSLGGGERMAFLFDRRRVELSGLAGELVVPPEWLDDIEPDALRRQFARTPYAVSFRSGGHTFILVTLHVLYGKNPAERVPELRCIARWMAEWAGRTSRWHQSLYALGDFNIDRRDDPLWQAFVSTGLHVPEPLQRARRSIFGGDDGSQDKFYDQIAWFESGPGAPDAGQRLVSAGSFDFVPHVYREQGLTRHAVSYRISDHLPLWAEMDLAPHPAGPP